MKASTSASLCLLALSVSVKAAGEERACLDCDRQLRKCVESLQAWRRAHGGTYPPSLSILQTTGLSGPQALGCPDTAAEKEGAHDRTELHSSRTVGRDSFDVYEYEMTDDVSDGLADVWPSDPVPTRRMIKSILLRRPFHEQIPLLRCSAHQRLAPAEHLTYGPPHRNATTEGKIYWSGKYWENVWAEDVPLTARMAFPAIGQAGPPFVSGAVPPEFVDLGRQANAFPQFAWWWGVPLLERKEQKPYLTAPSLAALSSTASSHRLSLGGTVFWLDGLIQLQGKVKPGERGYGAPQSVGFPGSRKGIALNRKFKTATWLQGTVFPDQPGRAAGSLIWHYAEGSPQEVPVVYGKETARFWSLPDQAAKEPGFPQPVWKHAETREQAGQDRSLRIYRQTWTNPWPEKMVTSLDFVSNPESHAAPFLIAVTLEL